MATTVVAHNAGRWRRLGEVVLPLVLFGSLVLVFLLPLRGQRIIAFRDLVDYATPHKLFAIDELRHRYLPLWNPYDSFGFPHLANLQSGVLYPVNVLLLLPFPFGLNLSILIHFVIAASGLFALARALTLGRPAATVGGISYGFSPYLVSLTDLNAFLFTSAWLPWLCLCGHRLGQRLSLPRIVTTAAVFAVGFLAGEPQTFAVGALVAVGFSLATGSLDVARLARLAVGWATAGVLTLLVVAPVLLPFLELMGTTERAGVGLTREQVYRYSLEPAGLVTLVAPGFAGDVVDGSHWLGSQTYVRRPYLGVSVLVLALLGWSTARRRALPLVALGVGALSLSLGPSGGLYPLLYDVGFRQSRFPVKFLVFSVFAVSVGCAFGFEALRSSLPRYRRWLAALLALLLFGTVLVFMRAPLPPAVAATIHVAVVAAVLLPTFLLSSARIVRTTMAIVVVLDLIVAGRPVITSMPVADYLAPTAVVRRAMADAPTHGCSWPRVFNPPVSADALSYVYATGRHDSVSLARRKSLLFGNLNLLYGLSTVRGGESAEIRWASDVLATLDRGPVARRLVDRVGAQFVVNQNPLEPFGFDRLDDDDGVALFGNPTVTAHAFIAQSTLVTVDSPERLRRLGDIVPGQVLVEEQLDGVDTLCAGGEAEVIVCEPLRVEITVDSPGKCLLVLTDTWFPGWKAANQTSDLTIYRVDHAFRGVTVAPGRSLVSFSYEPASFHTGVRLCCVGIGLSVALLLFPLGWSRVRRRDKTRGG